MNTVYAYWVKWGNNNIVYAIALRKKSTIHGKTQKDRVLSGSLTMSWEHDAPVNIRNQQNKGCNGDTMGHAIPINHHYDFA